MDINNMLISLGLSGSGYNMLIVHREITLSFRSYGPPLGRQWGNRQSAAARRIRALERRFEELRDQSNALCTNRETR
ncbi:hypothetical protein HanXRQr2_Chr11g0506051 [Helianthus annuus]|uniref:Uncharacterized protein n=1 Tax=Helianthus annuus TaxID=4232 RepID=A0A1Y3BX62_HELAN|nr:hypothetical protein HanXRQr2_Chr11g0506051 [Helianthus annuus]KAJ0876372.1 hypothetical protein HanPSC8_Chr11g0487651 [Helianthus annuus]